MGLKFSRSAKMVPVNRNDLFYKMDHHSRGIALIFNHVNFNYLDDRVGSDKDCKRITRTLTNLGFETRVYEDLEYLEIEGILKQVSVEDHSEEDCLVIVMMTHGDTGILYAKDNFYHVNILWDRFTDQQCPTLAGKPKLFFIQACRGWAKDKGVLLTELENRCEIDAIVINECELNQQYQNPTMISTSALPVDTLIMYSTVNGYISFREPDEGSWFIQDLCTELEVKAESHTLQNILTFTTRRVAERITPTLEKQIPSTVSQLTRLISFGKKENSE